MALLFNWPRREYHIINAFSGIEVISRDICLSFV